MHEPLRSHLEEYIARPDTIPLEATTHLKQCGQCRAQFEAMILDARVVRALRPDYAPEPRAGFYARVMERIEAQRPVSMWAAFMDSAFGSRLALASAALTIVMGFFLVHGEPLNRPAPMQIEPQTITAVASNADEVPVRVLENTYDNDNDKDQVRNAVFVSLASYRD